MKKKIVFIGVALIIATGSSLAQQQVLHKALLEENSITFVETYRDVTYEIADIQKMTYEGNVLHVFLKDKTIYSVDVTSLSINNNGEKTQDAELIESINKLQVSIYPNPAIDDLKIEYTLPANDNIRISILNLSGQIEKEVFTGALLEGKNSLVVPISDLPGGMHLVMIKGLHFSITKSLIKQ